MQQHAHSRLTGHELVTPALCAIRERDGLAEAISVATQMIGAAASIIARERGHDHLHEVLYAAARCALIVTPEA